MQIRTQGNLVSARPFALLSGSIEVRWNHDNGGSVEQAANDVTSRKELVVDIVGAKALKRRLGPNRADEAPPGSVDVPEDAPPVFHWVGIGPSAAELTRPVPTTNRLPVALRCFGGSALSFR
jgi:hypothetical protein